jgi:peptidoglycan/xylan/chitin deacetylase (PgdA/CDA1 family)
MLKSSPAVVPVVSFDDGHRSNYEHAFPMLEQFGVKATFFVLAGCIGKSANYMSWTQVRDISAAGHHLRSHGWSHRILTQCRASELNHELSDSKHEIEQRSGVEVDSISAPGGRWNARVAEACARAGYRHLYHSNSWASARSLKGLSLHGRLMVTGQMEPEELMKAMRTQGMRRWILQAKYGAKEGVRSALGDRLYHKIWCWLANWNPEDGMEVRVDGPARAGEC